LLVCIGVLFLTLAFGTAGRDADFVTAVDIAAGMAGVLVAMLVAGVLTMGKTGAAVFLFCANMVVLAEPSAEKSVKNS
jgi:hypothetical protein